MLSVLKDQDQSLTLRSVYVCSAREQVTWEPTGQEVKPSGSCGSTNLRIDISGLRLDYGQSGT